MNEKWVADEIMALKKGGIGKHASTHSNSGDDRVTLDSSQITSGTLDAARMPIATAKAVGSIKVGTGLSITDDGTLSADGSENATWGKITGTLSNQTDLNNALSGKAASSHTHAASEITSGTISSSRLPTASTSSFGMVKVGSGITVSGGVISASGGTPFLSLNINEFAGLQSAVDYGISKGATTLYIYKPSGTLMGDEGLTLTNVSGPAITIYVYCSEFSSQHEINLNGNITMIVTTAAAIALCSSDAENCIVLNNGAKLICNSGISVVNVCPWGTGTGMKLDNGSEFLCCSQIQYQGGSSSTAFTVNHASTFRCSGKITYSSGGGTYVLTLTNCSFAIVGALGNSSTKISNDTSSIVFVNGTKQS